MSARRLAALAATGLAALAAALTFSSPPAGAAPSCTVEWTGDAGTTAWDTAGNWRDASSGAPRVPAHGDEACILEDGAAVVLAGSSPSLAALTVGSGVPGETASLRVEAGATAAQLWTSAGTTIAAGGTVELAGSGAGASSLAGGATALAGELRTAPGGGGARTIGTPLEIAAGGELTVDASTTYGSSQPLVNRGTTAIAAGATLAMNGGSSSTFEQRGTLHVLGALGVGSGDTLELHDFAGVDAPNGLTLDGAAYLKYLGSGALDDDITLTGSASVYGNVPAGHTLRVVSGTSAAQAYLMDAGGSLNPVTNAGTIELDGTAEHAASLAGAKVVNGGTIRSLPGGTGARSFVAVENTGGATVDIDTPTTYASSAPLVNEGTLAVAAGASLSLNGGSSSTLEQRGTLQVLGALDIGSSDALELHDYAGLDAPGGLTLDGSAYLKYLGTGALDDDITLTGSASVYGNVPAGHTLRVVSGTSAAQAYLMDAGGSLNPVTNAGTIELDGTGDQAASLAGAKVVNEGLVHTQPGGTGARSFVALDNRPGGTVDVDVPTTYASSSPLVNRGTLAVAAGASLSLNGGSSSTLEQRGTLQVLGTLGIGTSDTLELHDYAGVSAPGGLTLDGSAYLKYLGTGALDEDITLTGGSSVYGDVPAGHTLRVVSGASAAEAYLYDTGGSLSPVTNHGTIELDGTATARAGLAGAPVTNAGTITVGHNAGGARELRGRMTNTGTITVEGGSGPDMTVTYATSAAFVNSGSLAIGDGAVLTLNGGSSSTLEQRGDLDVDGELAIGSGDTLELHDYAGVDAPGGLTLDGSAYLRYAGTGTLDERFTLTGGSSVYGDVPAGHTLRVVSGESAAQAYFYDASGGFGGVVNRGTIELDRTGTPVSSVAGTQLTNQGRLAASGGGEPTAATVTNADGGVIAVGTATKLKVSALTNDDGATLDGGAYDLDGHLQVGGTPDVTTLATGVRLGAGGAFTGSDGTTGVLRNLAAIATDGGLDVGRAVSVPAVLTNAGALRVRGGGALQAPAVAETGRSSIAPGGSVALTGAYVKTAGRMDLHGTLDATVLRIEDDAELRGTGTVDGDLTNEHLVRPGTSASADPGDTEVTPGTLAVTGDYAQAAGAALALRADGAADASTLDVAGAATLDPAATMRVEVDPGYTPGPRDTVTALDAGSRTGTLSDPIATVPAQPHGRYLTRYAGPAVQATFATAPGAPQAVDADAGNTRATVTWDAPAEDGGAPVTGYRVTATPGAGDPVQATAGADDRELVLAGLNNDTAYDVTVVAINVIGDGAASTPVTVTPVNLAPVASFTVAPAAPNPGQTVTFTSTSTDDDAVAAQAWDLDDDGDFDDGTGTTAQRAFATTGPHDVSLRVTDADGAGDTETVTVTVSAVTDTTDPVAVFASGPADNAVVNTDDVTFAFQASEAATFTCALDVAAPASCESPKTLSGLAEGPHSFTVVPTDAAGNEGAPIRRTFVVDTTVPVVTITAPAKDAVSASATVRVQGAAGRQVGDEPVVGVAVIPDVEGPTEPVWTGDAPVVDGAYAITTGALPNGRYVAIAVQFDHADNYAVETVPFSVNVPAKGGDGGQGGGGGGGGGSQGGAQSPQQQPPVTPPATTPESTVIRRAVTAAATAIGRSLTRGGLTELLAKPTSIVALSAPGPGEAEVEYLAPRTTAGRASAAQRKARTVVVARGRKTVTAAGTVRVRVKTTAAGRKLMRRARTLRLTVRTTFTPRGGRPATAQQAVTLKRKKPKAKSRR